MHITAARQQSDIISKAPLHIFYYTRPLMMNTALLLPQSKFLFNCTQCITFYIVSTALICRGHRHPCPHLPRQISMVTNQGLRHLTSALPHFSGLLHFNSALHFRSLVVVASGLQHFRTSAF